MKLAAGVEELVPLNGCRISLPSELVSKAGLVGPRGDVESGEVCIVA